MESHHPGSKIAVAGVHRLDVIMRIRGKNGPARSRHLELVSALEGIADESGSAVQTQDAAIFEPSVHNSPHRGAFMVLKDGTHFVALPVYSEEYADLVLIAGGF